MITLKNISLAFGEREVFKDFSLTLPNCGLFLLTGVSGIGKTSLLRMLCGLQSPDSGEISTQNAKISVVFQEDRLLGNLTALQNVSIVSDADTAYAQLEKVGLSASAKLYPDELSGGMKRRVALARALAFGGDVLILDEAFTGIDEPMAREIIKAVTREYRDRLIIAATHQPELFSACEYKTISL